MRGVPAMTYGWRPMGSSLVGADEPATGAPSSCERTYFRARRPVEVSVSILALLLLMPLLVMIGLAVLVDQGRPILFRQVRPGRSMRPFTLYKFRTMRGPCDCHGVALRDPERISMLGRGLRRTRLDELPQLFNVLRGEMSVIGPRPLLACYLPDQVTERTAVRPGITGWAQVHGGQRLSVEEKIALDNWYLRNAGLWIDLRIVCRTLRMMVLGKELRSDQRSPKVGNYKI
jgi:lipopolysaccharide/colanic/teichoic acid biosynthesis glycosyltransferase